MKKKVIGLMVLGLVAIAWGRGELRTSTVDGISYTYTINKSHGNKVVTIGATNRLAIPKTTKGDIVIPASIDGMPVTKIGPGAFSGCMNLTSVVVPEGIESIDYSAFKDCISLTSITLPSTLKEVDGFEDCISLTSVRIPNDVVSVRGFSGCTSLESITIPETVKELGSFMGCKALKSIFIPKGVTKLGSFSGCKSLSSITIPDGVKSFSGFPFCTSLTSIILPPSIIEIPDNAFMDCKNLTNITMQGNVMSIGDCAFENCPKLSSITIPSTTKKIGWRTFANCTFTSISIPSGVMALEKEIFDDCTNLSSIVFMGEPPKRAFRLVENNPRNPSPVAVGIYSSENATKWKEEIDSNGEWNGIPMVEISSFTDDIINAAVVKARQDFEEKKILLLREEQNTLEKATLIAEDLNGLNISNLVIRQVCHIPNSGGFLGLRIFSYALTITDGRITKIEKLPDEKIGEKPIIPIIMEKNK